MLSRKDLVALFKSGSWQDDSEFERLAGEVEVLGPDDVLELLSVLSGRTAAVDPTRQRLRRAAFVRVATTVRDKRLFLPYLRALKGADPSVRAVVADLLPGVNDPAQHGELCALLASPEPELRQVASLALRSLAGRSAFEILSQMVTEPQFSGRSEAMAVLSATAAHHAIPVYESVLGVGSPAERAEAIGHLVEPVCVQKNLPRVLLAVGRAVSDTHENVRVVAIAALAAHATQEEYFERAGRCLEDASPNVARAAVRGLQHFPGSESVSLLRRALRRGPNMVRLAALDALQAIGTPEVLDPIVEGLGHRQVVVRGRAADILVQMGRAGKVDLARTVLWLLRSHDVNVRRLAVEVAATVKDPDGTLWPKMVDFLYDEDWWVRERIVDALVDMAGDRIVTHFIQHLEDTDVVRRYYAVEILRRLGSSAGLGALLRAANGDSDWLVRERAIQAVAATGDERAIPALVNIMMQEADLRLVCVEALEGMGVKSAASHVALLLTTEGMDPDEELAVLRCLGTLGDAEQATAVRRRLKDTNPDVRNLARDLIWRWEGQQQSGPPPTSVLDQLLTLVVQREGDDLILSPGRRPSLKRMGRILPIVENVFSAEQIEGFLRPILSRTQIDDLEAQRDVDLSYEIGQHAQRFRVNVFGQRGGWGAVFRVIREQLLQLEALGLPPVVRGLSELKNGLVLVGGPTGSGKSATLAALIDDINQRSARHIITLEDPIEVAHRRKQSLINQRELGTHTRSLHRALRATLREDPDVILVGEMRDAATIAFGITAAETGHLVFGTVHTVSAASTVDRLVNACPIEEQDHVRAMLAGSLRAVVCQYLHRRRDQPGRVLSVEVLVNSEAVANLIRTGKTHQIPSVIATSRQAGMQLMDTELMRLVQEGRISGEDAYMRAANKKDFEALVAGASAAPVASGGM
jgi:twitching motility protein PilT